MIVSKPRLLLSACAVLALVASGCGKGTPPTGKVTGKVLLDGEPLTTGSVLYIPNPTGQYASGKIDKDGSYSLTTFVNGDGAVLGKHRIIVSAVKEVKNEGDPVVPLTPSKYSNENTSGLEADVKKGENVVDLNLSSQDDQKGKRTAAKR
ncbi:hypothetical protein SAMN05421753_11422 [Planctomicrobium piriforme]|uniref:Carboxypeptidase regulatory-like domain-containing protein n=2 Tax=Planctomicrobium piriforme TaxID=1576369 RepID=A0A1I3MJQ1_9PLAN|nr:hypothetical protein SAMN05421753_11422 [Planctomicrobium piriforme]